MIEHELAASYAVLGAAYAAEEAHEDKDLFRAAAAYYRASDLHPENQQYWDQIKVNSPTRLPGVPALVLCDQLRTVLLSAQPLVIEGSSVAPGRPGV